MALDRYELDRYLSQSDEHLLADDYEDPEDVTVLAGYPLVTDEDVYTAIQEAVREHLKEAFVDTELDGKIHVNRAGGWGGGSVDWLEIELPSGAAWQIHVKRKSWPTDGSSTQWDID